MVVVVLQTYKIHHMNEIFDKSLNKTLFPRHFSICEEIRN